MDPQSKKLAEFIARCAYEKKGDDILLMDMSNTTIVCDYFVIVTASSRPHTRALCDYISDSLTEYKGAIKIQGKEDGGWIVMDTGLVVVHIFLENMRNFYNLEGFWKDTDMYRPEFEAVAQEENA